MRTLGRKHQPHQQMIVEVGADARLIEHHRYAVLAQMIRRADAGEHQKLRRLQTAAADDHFLRRRAKRRSCPCTIATTPRHWPPAMSSLVTVVFGSSVRFVRDSAGSR